MKNISETHPSLKDKSYMYEPVTGYGYCNELIQKHTIDKAVLRQIIYQNTYDCNIIEQIEKLLADE